MVCTHTPPQVLQRQHAMPSKTRSAPLFRPSSVQPEALQEKLDEDFSSLSPSGTLSLALLVG
eukprot:5482323-Alexandrium_andersonii.AAC.1